MIRPAILLAVLAGCTTGPLVPEGTDYVEISVTGPFNGVSSRTIFATDAYRRGSPIANAPDQRVSWAMLPEGSYANARQIVERGFPRVSDPQLDLCPTDTAVTRITVSDPVAGQTSVRSGCVPNGFAPVLSELMALLPPWPRPADGAT